VLGVRSHTELHRTALDTDMSAMVGSPAGITEPERPAVAMSEGEHQFRQLFARSPDAIVLIDPHDLAVSWPIVDCNEAACRMNGYTRGELIGKSIDTLNTTRGTPEERAAYLVGLRREGVLSLETLHRHREGHTFPVEVSTWLVSLGARELVLGIDRDITLRSRPSRPCCTHWSPSDEAPRDCASWTR